MHHANTMLNGLLRWYVDLLAVDKNLAFKATRGVDEVHAKEDVHKWSIFRAIFAQ